MYALINLSFVFLAADVWTATSTAASAAESATTVEHNGTTANDIARKSNGCASIRYDERWNATTATSTAGKNSKLF